MAWFPPVTFLVGQVVLHDSTVGNIYALNTYLRNNLNDLALHDHSGAGVLGSLVSITFIDAAVPGTPSVGNGTHTRIYTTGTAIGLRSGSVAGSAARIISNTTHTHGGL